MTYIRKTKMKYISKFNRVRKTSLLALLFLFLNVFIINPLYNARPWSGEDLEVHFIDVGQGDSILIQSKDMAMVIDGGENHMGERVVTYLKSLGIEKLDYLVATHPHSDHIGGIDTILYEIPVDTIIMPHVYHSTKTYADVIKAIKDVNGYISYPEVGDLYPFNNGYFTIVAPNNQDYSNINNYSIGIRLTHGYNDFLFTSDAEIIAEEEMLSNGLNLSSEVYKLAHHGSTTSNSSEFLDAVNPYYAVATVGYDNDYGHPHNEILKEMVDRNIKLYRTDLQGTIIITSNGSTLKVNTTEYTITEEDIKPYYD